MNSFDDVRYAYPRASDENFWVTSEPAKYNCISWVERDVDRWWEPGNAAPHHYWPAELGDADDLAAYLRLFRFLGFVPAEDDGLEESIEKICIYTRDRKFVHVAFQRSDGDWSSKLSWKHDVRHRGYEVLLEFRPWIPDSIESVYFMQRERRPHPAAEADHPFLTS